MVDNFVKTKLLKFDFFPTNKNLLNYEQKIVRNAKTHKKDK